MPLTGATNKSLPFTDDELRKMYDACETRYGKQVVKWSRDIHHQRIEGVYDRYNRKWTGQDLANFISVSVYTGLRISDVATFPRRPNATDRGNPCQDHKGGRMATPGFLNGCRNAVNGRTHGPLIFGEHQTKDMNVVTNIRRRKLNKLWALWGPWKEKPTPHRFRHSSPAFSWNVMAAAVRDVAELLGNTEQIVRKRFLRGSRRGKDAWPQC